MDLLDWLGVLIVFRIVYYLMETLIKRYNDEIDNDNDNESVNNSNIKK